MTHNLTSTSTIAEIEAALAAGTATMDDADAILCPRSHRDSPSGKRAKAWLDAHTSAPVLTSKPKAHKATGAGARGGSLPKRLASEQQNEFCATKNVGKFSPEGRAEYKRLLVLAQAMPLTRVANKLEALGIRVSDKVDA